jgi:threonyl-tRNA synthetase
VAVLPVSERHQAYAQQVHAQLEKQGFYADCLLTNATLPKRIREAQTEQYNFIVVVGDQEIEQNTVSVRTRDGKVLPSSSLDVFVESLVRLQKERK